MRKLFLLFSAAITIASTLQAQNPVIRDQFTADPTARVFNGKVYIYPSHDIPSPIDRLKEWFCMADYHVFSSTNLTDWTDHGVILTQNKVPWVQPDSYSMWAPDCVYKDGKYYFYFPSTPQGEGCESCDDAKRLRPRKGIRFWCTSEWKARFNLGSIYFLGQNP